MRNSRSLATNSLKRTRNYKTMEHDLKQCVEKEVQGNFGYIGDK